MNVDTLICPKQYFNDLYYCVIIEYRHRLHNAYMYMYVQRYMYLSMNQYCESVCQKTFCSYYTVFTCSYI